jgi:archaellum component FlaG (FlaF/FlaG flagellin family)
MGFSITITEAIMIIASVVLASAFSSYAIYAGTSLQSNIMQNLDDARINMDTHLEIVYAIVNQTSGPSGPSPLFIIYVKNTGEMPITDMSLITLYVGAYGQVTMYSYNPAATTGNGTFNIYDSSGNGVINIGEAAEIEVFNATPVTASLYEAELVLYRGIPSYYLFSPP